MSLIRVAKDEFNEPLFCFNDVCKSLELTNTKHAKRSIGEKVIIFALKVSFLIQKV
ncbi:hypothetical protein AVCANL283_05005 [Campylobacter canadensis]|uniref:Bro-N domain-containing protein n=1 Tax=Campylobacter canadensis TaxID=449520 RepID=A0ABS7WRU7_9BACT|nr:hypothetical protein [Campylobacter canadensis]MBZ7998653.1 hypothetical protein [Campylobacter canadensis]